MDEMHSDPKNWKWGVFYFNPDDRRIIVPKRNPLFGITFNFANPFSYIIIAGTCVLIAILAKLTR